MASVKFNERFRDAVEINVLGTKKILDLIMETKHLKVSFIDTKKTFYFYCYTIDFFVNKIFFSSTKHKNVQGFFASSLHSLTHMLLNFLINYIFTFFRFKHINVRLVIISNMNIARILARLLMSACYKRQNRNRFYL